MQCFLFHITVICDSCSFTVKHFDPYNNYSYCTSHSTALHMKAMTFINGSLKLPSKVHTQASKEVAIIQKGSVEGPATAVEANGAKCPALLKN